MNQKNYTKTKWFRGIAFALAFLLAMPTALGNVAPVSADDTIGTTSGSVLYGDVDGDKSILAADALLALKHAAKLETLEGDAFKAANVTGGEALVDAADALLILQYAAKLIDKFPVEGEPDVTETPVTTTPVTETETPVAETETPVAVTETPVVTPPPTIIPTEEPTPVPTPTPPPVFPTHITESNAPEYAVEGIPVKVENLNGAEEYTGDANGAIYTFTDANASKRTGIKIENPIVGNADYQQDYAFVYDLEDPTGQGRVNVFRLTGSRLGWGRDEDKLPIPEDQLLEKPDTTQDNRVWYVAREDEVYYPKPTDKGPLKGFSMSFWAKTDKDQDNSAILTFANTNQTTTVSINAAANYSDSQDSQNFFSTSQHADDPNYRTGEWEYYTVTFANDWICVYINGVEVKYDQIELSRKKMRSFNNGFLTRYNAAVTWTEEDFANDWQGYLTKDQRGTSDLYPTITSDNYTVFGNGRYRGLGAVERLMLTYMTGMTTEVYLGGAVVEAASGAAKYSSESGTQIAQVKYYLDELNYEQAYANYLLAETPVYKEVEETPVVPTETGDVPVETATPEPVDPLDGKVLNIIKNWGNITENVVSENGNAYNRFDTLVEVDGEYYGAKMENPFELNTNITQTAEEALAGQELIPATVEVQKKDDDGNLMYEADGTPIMETVKTVAGDSTSVQYWRGNYYSDYYYGDPTKYGNFMTEEEKNPATATEKYKYQKPVWTKGASVGFWFNPSQALIDSKDPIWTMGKVNEYFFTLAADGTVQYYDGQGTSFKGGQVPFKANMQCYNTFTAKGDASKIKAGEWNYYLVTFANDWIQVYVNGEELIYSMAGIIRGYTKHFNAGFLTRYNNIGMVTEDPDPVRQYITKAGGLTVLPEVIDETVNGNDETCVRTNGVYGSAKGYNAEGTKGEYGSQNRLMMDSLTIEGGNFYMGGYATAYKKSANWASNAIKTPFYTDHTISDGSAFADVRFYEFEATADQAFRIYQRRVETCPGPVVKPTDTPTPAPATDTPPPTDTPTPAPATDTPPPTDTPAPTDVPAEEITYDAETNTYTMGAASIKVDGTKGENAALALDNPFAGLDMTEEIVLGADGTPDWKNGGAISYWVNIPEGAGDSVLFTFELTEDKVNRDDLDKMNMVDAYSEEDASYAMGTIETYVAIADDGTETEYSVMSGHGKNVRYNPNYPAEGLYEVHAEKGTIDVVKKGADIENPDNWTKIRTIGTGYYAGYADRYEADANSVVKEYEGTSVLNIFASGSVEFFEDYITGKQLNPNGGNYDTVVSYYGDNVYRLAANNNPLVYSTPNWDTAKTPATLAGVGSWHFVVVEIQNNWITVYMDGEVLTSDHYNYWGGPIGANNQYVAKKLFNKGYGAKGYTLNTNPSTANSHGLTLTDIITDTNTKFYLGGQNVGSNLGQMAAVGTASGVQIKDIKYYSTTIGAENITADGVVNVEAIDYSKLTAIDVVDKNSNAEADENGVYTFGELVADGETTYSVTNAETGAAEEVKIGHYYGVEFDNPFAGNTRITQTVAEALAHIPAEDRITHTMTDSRAKNNGGIVGRENNFTIDSGIGYGDTYTTEDGSKTYTFQRPVWTKGATVSFWYNPADLTDKTPIYTMYGENQALFTMLSDGTVAYFDMCNDEWKNAPSQKGYSHSTNGFYAKGDASKVTQGAWNYYTITFANDWIQVYINGEELAYTYVSLELVAKTMGNHFNGGFGYRYSPTGMLTEDTTHNQYLSKSTITKNGLDAILDAVVAEDGTVTYTDADGIARNCGVRVTSVYRRANNDWKSAESKEYLTLMMDRLTDPSMRFFMGGLPTEMSSALNENIFKQGTGFNPTKMQGGPANKAVGVDESIDTNHGQVGSQFKDVRFAEKEYTAAEVKAEYDAYILNPISYDEETDTYTLNGQNNDGTNASYALANPFAGVDMTEEIVLGADGTPDWSKGGTIAYWAKIPAGAGDAVLFTFELTEDKVNRDDLDKMNMVDAYSEEDASYAMGTIETYVAIADDGTETEYSVMSGHGKNVRYNPNYPAEGLYEVHAEKGTIDVVKKGADIENPDNWTKIRTIGTGYYAGYADRYEADANSVVKEYEGTSVLNIFASGSVEFFEDYITGKQENPNGGNYDSVVSYYGDNVFRLAANNNPLVYSAPNWDTAKTPATLEKTDEWHFVVVQIQNNWVTVYMDGEKLTSDHYNYWGGPIGANNQYVAKKLFNKGYGAKGYTLNTNPSTANSHGLTLTELITNENTNLYIGGQNVGSNLGQMATVGTAAGVQVKDVEFYPSIVKEDYITAEGLDFSKIIGLEAVDMNSSATVNDEGVYTFGELVADDTITFTDKTGATSGQEVTNNLYYGVEFDNPFAGNTRIQQTVLEALEGQDIFDATMKDSRVSNVVGHENNFKVDSAIGFGDTYTAEDGTVYTYHRPVYTKGASVNFWYNPADVSSNTPIFTMYGEQKGLFVLLADGTVAYFDMSSQTWKDASHTPDKLGSGYTLNGFFAAGDATKVTQGQWNYYTVTFANDWIQVYINGEELVYSFVSLELQNKTLGYQFNGGYGYRYNPTGMVTEDPDPVRQYVTKVNGILTAVTAEDGTVTYTDDNNFARNIGVRSTSIYRRAQNYRPVEDKGEVGANFVLMMDRLTDPSMKFYIGGCPTKMSVATNSLMPDEGYNPTKPVAAKAENKQSVEGIYIDTNHGQVGSQFKDVTFVEKELTAAEAKELYASLTGGSTPEVTEVPATEVPATEVPATEVPATEVPATEVPVAATLTGNAVTVDVYDSTYTASYAYDDSLQVGDQVFGDRAIEKSAFTTIPESLIGSEYILTPADAKNINPNTTDPALKLTTITASKDVVISVGFDSRLAVIPSWVEAEGLVKTDLTCLTSNNLTFVIYQKELKAGESVTLSSQGQKSGVMGYIVAVTRVPVAKLTGSSISVNVWDSENPEYLLDDSLQVGDQVFGDRTIDKSAFTTIPESLIGSEYILTPADAKNINPNTTDPAVELTTITASKDVVISVGFDSRLAVIPSWVEEEGLVKTDLTCLTSNNLTFVIYQKELKAGESVTLSTQGQKSGVMGYIVAATSANAEATPDTTATPEPTAEPTPLPAGTFVGEDFEDASDIILNNDQNTSVIESVVINSETGATSNVVTLGTLVEGVEDAMGVEIANPLAGEDGFNQTLVDGLKNANAVLAGDFAQLLVDKDTYYEVAATQVEGVTYPRPTYTNGVVFSAWVKVPAETTAATPLISWYKNDEFGMGTLTVMSDGRVGFLGGGNANGVRSDRNAVMYTPADSSVAPLAKAGQWVYITIAVENYQIQAYFDGVKATMNPDSNFAGTGGKMFNKGFSYYGNDDPATSEDRRNNYRDLLKAFTKEEVDAFVAAGTTAGADVSKFGYLNTGAQFIVDYMTDADTKIYLGGLNETLRVRGASSNVESNYSAKTAGVQLDDITIVAYDTGFAPDTVAEEAYAAAVVHK